MAWKHDPEVCQKESIKAETVFKITPDKKEVTILVNSAFYRHTIKSRIHLRISSCCYICHLASKGIKSVQRTALDCLILFYSKCLSLFPNLVGILCQSLFVDQQVSFYDLFPIY